MSMAFFGWINPYKNQTTTLEVEYLPLDEDAEQEQSGYSIGSLLADAMSFQRQRNQRVLRPLAVLTLLTTAWLLFPRTVFAKPRVYKGYSQLTDKGLTQTPDAKLQQKIEARQKADQAKAAAPKSDVEPLSLAQMKGMHGRGPYRNAYFNGTLPWQRSFHDVNLSNGNLSKNFTDVMVAPGRGAGLALNRTYNSNDERAGAFGTGWTHAYDIRIEEAGTVVENNVEKEIVPRTDFFGGKHKYTRDADGLYTPPGYMYDEMDSRYDDEMISGLPRSLEDTQVGKDGTIKHFIPEGLDAAGHPSSVRICDYIEDRFGNRTTLTYGQTITLPSGATKKLLTQVKDSVNRTLTFTWVNYGTSAPAYRITQIQSPTYTVTYDYYQNASDPASYLNLWKVHLDSTGLNRTTTYTYTTFQGETGLLASIVDPIGNTVTYQYSSTNQSNGPTPTGTVWVGQIGESAGVDAAQNVRTQTWTLQTSTGSSFDTAVNVTVTNSQSVSSYAPINAVSDGNLRCVSVGNGWGGRSYQMSYDSANNLTRQQQWHGYTFTFVGPHTPTPYADGTTQYNDFAIISGATYGPHGNVLTQYNEGDATKKTTYTYYDASKYFQKKSIADPLGNTSTFDYYDKENALKSSTTTASAYDSQFVIPVSTTNTNLNSTWKIKRPEFTGTGSHRVAFGWVTPSNQQLSCTINANGAVQVYRWTNCVSGTGTAIYTGGSTFWQSAPFASQEYWYVRAVWTTTNVKFQYSFDQSTWTDIYTATTSAASFTTHPDRATISVGNGNSLAKSSSVRLLGYSDDAAVLVAPLNFGAWSWLNAMGATASSGVGGGNLMWARDAGYTVPTSPSYNKQLTYTYNQYGQKASETNQNGIVTNYTYGDAWGNLTQVVQDPGTTGHLNRTTTIAYDTVGKMTSNTNPNGETSTFAYNTLGQTTSASYPVKTGISAAETISYTYGANGRTSTVTDGRGTTTIAYEAGCDRVASVTDPVTGTTGYTYTPIGTRKAINLPGGGTVTYTFVSKYANETGFMTAPWVLTSDNPDQVGERVLSIIDDQNRKVDVAMDHTGLLYATYFNQVYNGSGTLVSYCKSAYTYDRTPNMNLDVSYGSNGRLKMLTTTAVNKVTNQTTLLNQNEYAYNNNGQRTSNKITTTNSSNVQVSRTENYTYDELNRLKTATYGDGQNQTYAFDTMGNRTAKTDNVTGNEVYTFDNANRIATRQVGSSAATTYTSDANGNTLTDATHTNTWDSQNRLVSSLSNGKTSAFKYGADGLRRKMSVTPTGQSTPTTITHYGYNGTNVIREWEENVAGVLSVSATYFVGTSGPMYKRPANAADVRWYVYDGLGSVVGEVDVNNVLQAEKKHDVYGLRRGTVGTEKSRHGFGGSLGHYSDDETGLVYMRARYYDPAIGRFVSQDPAYHGLNWFIYGGNDPVNRVDRDGRKSSGVDEILEQGQDLIDKAKEIEEIYQKFGKSWDALQDFLADCYGDDPAKIEEAWGTFMEVWTKNAVQDVDWSTFKDYAEAIKGGVGTYAWYVGTSSISNGAQMTLLCMGYEARLEYYLNL